MSHVLESNFLIFFLYYSSYQHSSQSNMVMQQSCKQQKATDACPMQNNKSHLCCPYLDRFSLHAHRQTLLVSAILAAVPLSLVNRTASFFSTCICEVFTHCTFEEPFATFTTAIFKDSLLIT